MMIATTCNCSTYYVNGISKGQRQRFCPTRQSHLLSLNSSLSLGSTQTLLPRLQLKRIRRTNHNSHAFRVPTIFASQSNIFKAIQTVLKIGKDGIEAGTNLVPDTIPRPVARGSVGVVATALSLFVIRSFLSTVFFAMGVMGFVYFVYLALNKDKGPKLDGNSTSSSTSTDEAIEEARKIMDKYK